jgi:hypothetical protein
MFPQNRQRCRIVQESFSKRHPPHLVDEHAESVAARLDCGDLTDEIAAQLRTLVRHRSELCPAVRELLITKLHLTARRNIGLADQLTTFAAQLAADFLQQLALRHDGRAADQSHHRSSVRNAARIPAAARILTFLRRELIAAPLKAEVASPLKHDPKTDDPGAAYSTAAGRGMAEGPYFLGELRR